MNIIVAVAFIVLFLSVIIIAVEIAIAPFGHEDPKRGFVRDEKPKVKK